MKKENTKHNNAIIEALTPFVSVVTAMSFAIFGLVSCSPSVISSADIMNSSKICGSQSPESYYWVNERREDLITKASEDLGQSFDGELRALSPDKTIKHYSVSSLECWASEGSGFSAYLLALSRAGISSMDDLSISAIENSAGSISWLNIAAKPSNCVDLEESALIFLGCRAGLAEAKYWLSLCYRDGLAGCARNRGKFLQLCREARDQGSTLAAQACRL